jgi:hypothetical protein
MAILFAAIVGATIAYIEPGIKVIAMHPGAKNQGQLYFI